MENMFYGTGYSSTIFTLDVSNFDTSNVTHMDYMFYNAGHNSDKLDIVFTIKNANTHTVFAFNGTALKEGTKVKVNYTNLTKGIANIAVNSKTEGANVVLGDLIEEINDDELSIGDEVQIANEYFNVMSINEDTITLLVQYNLGTDYRQTASYNPVKFSDTHGWEYTPGPKEIDIETWSPNIKTYLNNYVEYLKETINDENIKGNLITLKDLETLGCTIPVNYDIESEESNCYNSPYGWIVNNQLSWTRSANSTDNYGIWYLVNSGPLNFNHYRASFGVRPTITISKSSLENYLKTS
jgi:surface protein